MSPHVVVHAPSIKTASTISHDDIPPQPLDPYQHEADPFRPLQSHDPNHIDNHLHSYAVAEGNQPRSEAVAIHRLPSAVLQRILWMVDADTFASLAILNRAWYGAAQSKALYAHHLSRCPSYALVNTVITGPFRKNDLYRLKSKFAAEIRRNLFRAYLRPRQTLINLISVSANSSAAVPGAEAFRFAFSPNGQTILALSSSRIYVIDATTEPITVRNELKTIRRPLAASVTDDGSVLAVLSSKHQANVYNLTPVGVQHVQVIAMETPPRTIALAPQGTVLAAAYEGGVEVFSLAPTALSTDRRAVRSEGVDSLNFSGDGSMLVGSTQDLEEPSTVVITAPFYTENDLPPKEIHSRMWTTQILFPQISSVCSHAELLQGHTEGDASWLFAYDHTLMSYRAVRTDDTRTGIAYFLNPPTSRRFSMPAPSTAPTATVCGTLVVAGFSGSGLWIYGVPEKLDISPDMGSVIERHEKRLQARGQLTSATGHLEPLMAYSPSLSGSSEEIEEDSLAAKVDWRESLFVKCQEIRTIEGYTAAKWVETCEKRDCDFPGKRLVVVAPGGVDHFVEALGDETMPLDGSRVAILDFDYAPSTGADREITIEVGDKPPELLTERIGDMDIEVAMERRRSVRDRGRGAARTAALDRSITTAAATQGQQWNRGRTTSASQPSSPLDVDGQRDRGNSPVRASRPSQADLQRSASAAGFATAKYPPRAPLASQQQEGGHIVYHRSPTQPWPSGDGWESPPPPYSTNSQGQIQPGIPLGSPLIQPRPLGAQQSSASPLTGIPENGHAHGQLHGRSFQRTFPPGHVPPTNHHSLPFAPQNGRPTYPDLPFMGESRPLGPAGVQYVAPTLTGVPPGPSPTPPNDQHVISPMAQFSPLNMPMATPVSAETSSRPGSGEGHRMSAPDTPEVVSPLNISQPAQQPFDSPSIPQHTSKPTSSGSITLTGANLQARLNHPTPPTPTTYEQMWQSQYATAGPPTPPKAATTATESPIPTATSFSVAPPTSDQMANLNRRMSQNAWKPLPSVSTNSPAHQNHNIATRDFSGRSVGGPSAPCDSWGSVGNIGPATFNKTVGLSNGAARNNSPASGRSIPVSSSTPNLLSTNPLYSQNRRPQVGRLDTIESISSSYGPGEPGFRSHSIGQVTMPNAYHNFYPQNPHEMQHAAMQPSHQNSLQTADANPPPSSSLLRYSRTRRGRKNKPGRDHGHSQTMPSVADAGKKEKGSKCVVM
ncbi:hypothetical protein EDD37DRAFT_630391 [Exophiala viscosa]|uniref:F-box domain-containing protein n=1 Tax=Exophiala viscosa TaxID=2486360 RepID=A0AAN6E0W6_9EURO|nr:hypothetical protein EDD36DRAFT_168910 [Exophiala viscosa]KAI1624177.1 hypothetical protein EDD37DRAFT_630391 [Exophiala viscosa]